MITTAWSFGTALRLRYTVSIYAIIARWTRPVFVAFDEVFTHISNADLTVLTALVNATFNVYANTFNASKRCFAIQVILARRKSANSPITDQPVGTLVIRKATVDAPTLYALCNAVTGTIFITFRPWNTLIIFAN